MRKTTFLWLFLGAICGAMLFHTSQQVTDGRTKLASIDAATQKEDESLRVLQAEWSYLNQPDRLEKLSKQYLDLTPLKGKQFGKVADLDAKPIDAAPATDTPKVAEEDTGAATLPAIEEKPDTPKPDVAEAAVVKPEPAKPELALTPVVPAKPLPLKIEKASGDELVSPLKAQTKPAVPKTATASAAPRTPLRNYVYSPPKPAALRGGVYHPPAPAGRVSPVYAYKPPAYPTFQGATGGQRDFGDVIKSLGGSPHP